MPVCGTFSNTVISMSLAFQQCPIQVFMVRRNPFGDYLTYVERYDYFPMPLPSWVD